MYKKRERKKIFKNYLDGFLSSLMHSLNTPKHVRPLPPLPAPPPILEWYYTCLGLELKKLCLDAKMQNVCC